MIRKGERRDGWGGPSYRTCAAVVFSSNLFKSGADNVKTCYLKYSAQAFEQTGDMVTVTAQL
jgi:hypothetical protein